MHHAAHLHLAGPDAQEQTPRNRVLTIELIKDGWFRIEGNVATDAYESLISGPDISNAAECIGADAETWVFLFDTEKSTLGRTKQIVFVHEFETRVEVILVQEITVDSAV
jgi:hypothetical protein